ncbi:MAG: alkyl hydroperoxide reductase [Planctomycetota bacterium]
MSLRAQWPRIALLAAALQCLIWGVFIVLMPERSSLVYGFSAPPTDLFLWQGTGLIIFLFGVGYTLASFDPDQHWGIVLIGLLAKVLGPIGMLWAVSQGQVPARVLVLIPIHDVLWWIPFALMIRKAVRRPAR